MNTYERKKDEIGKDNLDELTLRNKVIKLESTVLSITREQELHRADIENLKLEKDDTLSSIEQVKAKVRSEFNNEAQKINKELKSLVELQKSEISHLEQAVKIREEENRKLTILINNLTLRMKDLENHVGAISFK